MKTGQRLGRVEGDFAQMLAADLTRDRKVLGVVLNRAQAATDETAYYYQPRHQRAATEFVEDTVAREHEDTDQLEMIYLEEDMVS